MSEPRWAVLSPKLEHGRPVWSKHHHLIDAVLERIRKGRGYKLIRWRWAGE